MPTVLLATCRAKPDLTPSDAVLAAALRARGAEVGAVPWDRLSPGAIGGATLCLRSTWDYHLRAAEFRRWVEQVGATAGALWNPAATVVANIDKAYLRVLAARGVSIPPTIWVEPGEDLDPAALVREAGWERGVLKPRISATAHGTVLVPAGAPVDPELVAPTRAAGGLLQAFMPEVVERGEVSLVFIVGACTHAVRKRARTGDFRVQHDFGGTATREAVAPGLERFGRQVLEASGATWLYARVDLVETADGPVLMELELIEPDLFLDQAPEAAERLAEGLRGAD